MSCKSLKALSVRGISRNAGEIAEKRPIFPVVTVKYRHRTSIAAAHEHLVPPFRIDSLRATQRPSGGCREAARLAPALPIQNHPRGCAPSKTQDCARHVRAPKAQSAGRSLMTRPPVIPHGSWPLEMMAEKAAGFCDEPSVEAFLEKVKRGVYSQPNRGEGCRPKWHRVKLEHDIARRHGLLRAAITEDLTGLI